MENGGAIAFSLRFPGARLRVDGSPDVLKLRHFFLLLSRTGLAFRRCELVRLDGSEADFQFALRSTAGLSSPRLAACQGELQPSRCRLKWSAKTHWIQRNNGGGHAACIIPIVLTNRYLFWIARVARRRDRIRVPR